MRRKLFEDRRDGVQFDYLGDMAPIYDRPKAAMVLGLRGGMRRMSGQRIEVPMHDPSVGLFEMIMWQAKQASLDGRKVLVAVQLPKRLWDCDVLDDGVRLYGLMTWRS